MEATLSKMKADLTSRPLIALLIILTIIAASALLTLALATLLHLNAPYDKTFADLNGAHLWLYFKRERIRARDIERIESLPEVTASTGVQYSVQSRVRIGDTRVLSSLRVLPVETQPVVNQLLIQQGRYLSDRQAEIVANEDFGYFYHLAVATRLASPARMAKRSICRWPDWLTTLCGIPIAASNRPTST